MAFLVIERVTDPQDRDVTNWRRRMWVELSDVIQDLSVNEAERALLLEWSANAKPGSAVCLQNGRSSDAAMVMVVPNNFVVEQASIKYETVQQARLVRERLLPLRDGTI